MGQWGGGAGQSGHHVTSGVPARLLVLLRLAVLSEDEIRLVHVMLHSHLLRWHIIAPCADAHCHWVDCLLLLTAIALEHAG